MKVHEIKELENIKDSASIMKQRCFPINEVWENTIHDLCNELITYKKKYPDMNETERTEPV